MSDSEILSPEDYSTSRIIREGKLVSSSDYKDVYINETQALKICFNEDPYSMQRLGTYLPQKLMPETVVREENLSNLQGYFGEYTVIHQEASDQIHEDENRFVADSLDKRLKNSENLEELGELIHILDSVVEDEAAITDPIVENFGYFDGRLKPFDICDIESVKHFPESFEPEIAEEEYRDEIRHMYADAITSTEHHTHLNMEETSQMFKETSLHIKDVKIIEQGTLTLPRVELLGERGRF